MSETNKPGIAFWIIGIIALIWNGWGSFLYIAQAFDMEIATEGLSQEQIVFMEGMPAWYTALFAIAVFVGVIGAITLLMQKKVSIKLFVISFIAAAINQVYWLFGTDAVTVFSEHQPYLMPAIIVVIGIFLIWYSKDQKAKGILS
jgi:small basic protein